MALCEESHLDRHCLQFFFFIIIILTGRAEGNKNYMYALI